MELVKEFPTDTATEHLSIRTEDNKYFVFQEEKRVSSELGNFQLAEAEIELLLLTRTNSSTAVFSPKERAKKELASKEIVLKIKNCKFCSTEFTAPNKRGFFRKIFCSKACCLDFHNGTRKNDNKEKEALNDINCIICGTIFTPTKSNHVCCTQRCSNINSIKKKKYSHIGEHSFLTLEANNKVKENLASTYFEFTIGSSEHTLLAEKGEELEIVLLDGAGNKMQASFYALNANLGPFKLQLEIKGKTKK